MESELGFSRETEATGNDIDTDIGMRFIIRSWLTPEIMGAERSPIYSRQAGDLRDLMIWFQSKFQGLRTRRVDSVSSSPSPSAKAGEDPCFSSETLRQRA